MDTLRLKLYILILIGEVCVSKDIQLFQISHSVHKYAESDTLISQKFHTRAARG